MGLFNKNWAKELDRADDLLARDLPVAALEIAERAEAKAEPDLRSRAADLVLRARQALLTSLLEKVDAAEAAGDLADAADWLASVIEREPSAVRRSRLEARRQALLAGAQRDDGSRVAVVEALTVTADEGSSEVDVAFQYETLVSMLADEVRPRYEERSGDFQQALVDLNEGRVAAAREAFERLAATAADDAVLRLELGRARFLDGESVAAGEDFAAAWEGLGDEPLDAGGSQFVAALWAEAVLASGGAEEVVERLALLAMPEKGDPEICRLYAVALLAAERREEALRYLEAVTFQLPLDAELNLLTARALAASGEDARAIAGLEQAIAASCGAGGCATPAAHVPSLRLLARLHLQRNNPERARELIAHVASAQHGVLTGEDHAILAEYYRSAGDFESAAAAAAEADRLSLAGGGVPEAAPTGLAPRQRRVL
jgi:tetratricopeptide (TPR) repeat protein